MAATAACGFHGRGGAAHLAGSAAPVGASGAPAGGASAGSTSGAAAGGASAGGSSGAAAGAATGSAGGASFQGAKCKWTTGASGTTGSANAFTGGSATAETGGSGTAGAGAAGSPGVPGGLHEEGRTWIGGPLGPYLLKGYTALQGSNEHKCTLHTASGSKLPLLRLMILAHPDVPFSFFFVLSRE